MPFSPLPKILLDHLAALQPGDAVVDLGCGEGNFGRLLPDAGIEVIGLDIQNWSRRSSARVVGDALSPPLRPGRVPFLLAGNLLRHVLAQDPAGGFLAQWYAALRPGGLVFICEDEPESGSAALRNYHRLQGLLARALPERRGPLVGLEAFRRLVAGLKLGGNWSFGLQDNDYPADSEGVLRFLRGCADPSAQGEVAGLVADIADHGLEYGRFWFACWQKDD